MRDQLVMWQSKQVKKMYNIKKIFNLLFVSQFLFPLVAMAGGENNINSLLSSWKNPVMSHCLGSNVGKATIGTQKDVCKGGYNLDNLQPSQCVLGDDMGMLMLVAREVNDRGARFCPTTIYAEKKKKGNAWTLYAEPAQGSQPCYWLCKPGYSGEGCNDTTLNGCDSVPITRNIFDNLTMARDPKVESAVAMFHWNQYKECWGNYDEEHDMLLVVSDWLPSGHGAYATPYVIRAHRGSNKSGRAGVYGWPAGESTLLCKNGYTANAGYNDCIPVDETTCALTQTCSNWPSNAFDEETMLLEYNNVAGCYQYRCREKGYAFPSLADRTCQPCTENLRGGASPDSGVCIQCDIGYIFDADSPSTNYCVAAAGYDKTTMQYGTGQSKETPLNNQCWMIAEAEAYSDCVKGIKKPTLVRSDLPLLQAVPAVTKVPTLSNYKLNQTTLKIAQ